MQTKAELEELALVEVDLADLERKVEELGVRFNTKFGRNYGSTSDICDRSQQISNQERKPYVYHIVTHVFVTALSLFYFFIYTISDSSLLQFS